jgi:hypothetical protein
MKENLELEWFADKLSMRAFAYAISQANKMQDKLNKMKKSSLIMYDEELLINPVFKVVLSDISSSVFIEIKDESSKGISQYSLCGCTTDADSGKIYARKNEVVEVFKRISFYKKF